MSCIRGGREAIRKDGHTRLGGQRWRCNDCRRRCTACSTSVLAARLPRRGDRRGRAPRRPLSSQLCGCGCVVRRARSRRGSQARCTGGCSASSRDFNKPPVSIARQSARHGGSMTRRSASRATGPMCIVLSISTGRSSMPTSRSGATPRRHKPSLNMPSMRRAARRCGWSPTKRSGIRRRCVKVRPWWSPAHRST